MGKFIRKLFLMLLLILLGVAAYLTFWPVGIKVATWEVSPMPKAEGILAPNDLLSKAEPYGPKLPANGPEDLVFDKEGNLYTGLENGQIIKISKDGGSYEVYADVGGRPFGLAFDKEGNLYVANGPKGLQVVTKTKTVKTLVSEAGGKPIKWGEEIAIADDGMIYFTDGSYKNGVTESAYALVDPAGRLISYDLKTGTVKELITGIRLANGVVLSYDQTFVLINESGTGRILIHWIKGNKAGATAVFVSKMPGLPDNIEQGPNGLYWVALFNDGKLTDMGAKSSFFAKVVLRLPNWLLLSDFATLKNSRVAAIDGKGQIVKFLQDGKGVIPNVTCPKERDGGLYLGNITTKQIHRVKLD